MVTSEDGASHERFLRETGLAATLAGVVEPVLEDLGFRLVRIQVHGKEGKTLQIMAERPDGTMTVDDCEAISRQISPVLDVADLISDSYRLEVSSPGIDRPLVRPVDFEDWAGYEAKIELSELIDGRKRFRGRIEGFSDGEVRLEVDLDQVGQTVLGLPVGLISEARLVLNDELIREALTRAKKRKGQDGQEAAADSGLGDGDEPPIDDLET